MAAEYTLVIRRYAPFKSFGGGYEGDDRQFSMSKDATARTIGAVTFSPDGDAKPSGVGRSSGSSYIGPWAVREGGKAIDKKVGQVRVLITNVTHTSDVIAFTVQTSGNLPMKDLALKKGIATTIDKANQWARPGSPKPEGTPDIDTYFDLKVQTVPGALIVSGKLRGDSFPNAEVFLLDAKSNAFPLLDYQTNGSWAGPIRLIIPHKNKERAVIPPRRVPLQADGSFKPGASPRPVTKKED